MERSNKAKLGELLPDIALPSAEGRKVRLSDYRGRSNLVVIFAAGKDDEKLLLLLAEAARKYSDIACEEAEVIVILWKERARWDSFLVRTDWPFVFLNDIDGYAHRLFNAIDEKGGAVAAVFITDRYGEIYAEYHAGGQGEVPGVDEVLQWLFFINSQCPECGVPEWPL